MRVIYTVEFAIDVDAQTKSMALHEAGTRWPELEDGVSALASNIVIKGIRTEKDREDPPEIVQS